jgi:hypothetical protein
LRTLIPFLVKSSHSSVLKLSQVNISTVRCLLLDKQTELPLRRLKDQQGMLTIYLNVERPPEMVACPLSERPVNKLSSPENAGINLLEAIWGRTPDQLA